MFVSCDLDTGAYKRDTDLWCRWGAAEGHSTRAGWRARSLQWWTAQHTCHRLKSGRGGRTLHDLTDWWLIWDPGCCCCFFGIKSLLLAKLLSPNGLLLLAREDSGGAYDGWTVPLGMIRELGHQDVFRLLGADDVVVELLVEVGGGLRAFGQNDTFGPFLQTEQFKLKVPFTWRATILSAFPDRPFFPPAVGRSCRRCPWRHVSRPSSWI